jgi:hypothetical protein
MPWAMGLMVVCQRVHADGRANGRDYYRIYKRIAFRRLDDVCEFLGIEWF